MSHRLLPSEGPSSAKYLWPAVLVHFHRAVQRSDKVAHGVLALLQVWVGRGETLTEEPSPAVYTPPLGGSSSVLLLENEIWGNKGSRSKEKTLSVMREREREVCPIKRKHQPKPRGPPARWSPAGITRPPSTQASRTQAMGRACTFSGPLKTGTVPNVTSQLYAHPFPSASQH